MQEIVHKGRKEPLLPQLSCPREEVYVEMIGKTLNTTSLTGEQAIKEEVLRWLASVALVHITAHGRMQTGETRVVKLDCSRSLRTDYQDP